MEILRYDRGIHQKERKYDMKHWNERGTGLLLCLCIAIPCWMLGRALPVIGGPVFGHPGRAWLSPCLSGIRAGSGGHRLHIKNNPAICRDPAWLRTESVGGRQGGRSVPAHHPVHHHHLPGGVLPSAQAAAYPLQHLYPGGSGLIRLRRLRPSRPPPRSSARTTRRSPSPSRSSSCSMWRPPSCSPPWAACWV